jgi:hypothetical protein
MKLPIKVFLAELIDIHARRKLLSENANNTEGNADFRRVAELAMAVHTAKNRLMEAKRSENILSKPVLALHEATRICKSEKLSRLFENSRAEALAKSAASAEKLLTEAKEKAEAEVRPSTSLGLVGLALSGGGIRSATFNLGVMQAVVGRGLFEKIDYISSVSGGGYTAGMLSAMLSDPKQNPRNPTFPLRQNLGQEESTVMKHLRTGASYLAPEGVLDKVRIPALFLRGLVVNVLLLLPYLLIAVVLTQILYGSQLLADKSHATSWNFYYTPTTILAALLAVWTVTYPIVRSATRLDWKSRNSLERSYALVFAAVVGIFVMNTLPVAVLWFRESPLDRIALPSGAFGTLLTVAAPLLPVLLASGTPRVLSTWRGKVMVYSLGMLGPIILLLIYLQLASWRVFEEERVLRWLCLNPEAATACSPKWLSFAGWVRYLFDHVNPLGLAPLDWAIAAAALVLIIYGIWAVDVNLTSLHGFYRDRISGAYLFCGNTDGQVQPNDQQRLSTLAPENSAAPYHLINATLNLQGSRRPGRKADFFLFSKYYTGSSLTGYCETQAMERADSRLDLGTAIAVSGAAVAPNMGTATNRALVFVMTLLNVRTGYWLPNPSQVTSRIKFTGVGPVFMMRELFGLLDEHSRYVNVSDGGHVENLGLYELLRRRCKYIIVCDSEADKDMTFNGLAKVMQYSRIDASVDVEINLSGLRMNNLGLCECHYAMGTIHYGDEETGVLIYLKASLCKGESEDIREYRIRRPTFPHESTREQFFNEGQFEAYRALGYHCASSALGDRRFSGANGCSVEQWVTELKEEQELAANPGSRKVPHAGGNGTIGAKILNEEL